MPMGEGLLAQASGGFGSYGAQANSFSDDGSNGSSMRQWRQRDAHHGDGERYRQRQPARRAPQQPASSTPWDRDAHGLSVQSVDGDSHLAAVSPKRETGPLTLTGALDIGWGNYDGTHDIAARAGADPGARNPWLKCGSCRQSLKPADALVEAPQLTGTLRRRSPGMARRHPARASRMSGSGTP